MIRNIALWMLILSGCAERVDAVALPGDDLARAEEAGMIAFLADYEVSTYYTLDSVCGLHGDAARAIDRYRIGPDLAYGTADDRTLASERQLLELDDVGPSTVSRVTRCADDFGYIERACDEPAVVDTITAKDDWRADLPSGLVSLIDKWQHSYDLCGEDYDYAPARFLAVDVFSEDCAVVGYTVSMVQTLEDDGRQFWITLDVDAELRVVDAWCEL